MGFRNIIRIENNNERTKKNTFALNRGENNRSFGTFSSVNGEKQIKFKKKLCPMTEITMTVQVSKFCFL